MKSEVRRLYVITPEYDDDGELTPDGREVARVLNSNEVKELMREPWAPSVLHEENNPDIMVLWDHGEGAHNPECFPLEDSLRDGWWKGFNVLPPIVWDLVALIAKKLRLENTSSMFWIRRE